MIAMHHFSFGDVVGLLVEVQIEEVSVWIPSSLFKVEYYQVGG